MLNLPSGSPPKDFRDGRGEDPTDARRYGYKPEDEERPEQLFPERGGMNDHKGLHDSAAKDCGEEHSPPTVLDGREGASGQRRLPWRWGAMPGSGGCSAGPAHVRNDRGRDADPEDPDDGEDFLGGERQAGQGDCPEGQQPASPKQARPGHP